ncbi:methyltransferase domain-containing protein [Streptomyces sp. NPDC007088]|uniref:methyltransferase domain-containing protein n=1 Tax=Streptomyces sp. NPDC007088 TaxID=3364773 RepID=UPI0036A2B12C
MTAREARGAEHGTGTPEGTPPTTAPAPGARWGHATDWDTVADTFDEEADHGLRDPGVRAAWAGRMGRWLPRAPSDVLDLGCGTGSLALLAAEAGHRVTAVDSSPRMTGRARAKLAGTGHADAAARVLTGDARHPPFAPRSFDVVLVRHLLWVLPDPAAALRRWCALLRPGGRLVLVEGFWNGTGLPAARLTALLAPLSERVHTESLSEDARLWGRPVDDERYAALAVPAPVRRHKEIVDVHLVLRRGDEVLLARRANTGYADGLLHAPSGHVEDGEDVLEAMLREAEEEVGLRLRPEDLRVATVMQHAAPSGDPRVGWFFEAEYGAGGEPFNAEPHKCSALDWYPLSDLPPDLIAYCRAGLLAYREGHRFVLHRHEAADPVAADPAVPNRARVLPQTTVRRGAS